MRGALRIATTVLPGGKIEVSDPQLHPGTPVELIVLLPEPPAVVRRSIVDVLAEAPGHVVFKTADEVDAYLREERDAWGMAMRPTSYSDEEIVRRAEELYEREIRAKVEEGNRGKILAIDVETGAYEVDRDLLEAVHRLRKRNPNAVLYSLRIGYPALAKMGGSWGRVAP